MGRSSQTLTAVLSEDGEVGNEKLLWIVLDKLNHEAQEAGQGGHAEPEHSSGQDVGCCSRGRRFTLAQVIKDHLISRGSSGLKVSWG